MPDPTVFVGHTDDTAHPNWLRAELTRVLYKLRSLGQLAELAVSLEPGTALVATEVACLRGIPVLWHPLYGPDTLPTAYPVPGWEGRVRALVQHPMVDVADSDGDGRSRARRRRRSVLLAEAYPRHVVVYDERTQGSTLDHLQRVLGTHDVIHVNPSTQRTTRIPPQEATTWLSTQPSHA